MRLDRDASGDESFHFIFIAPENRSHPLLKLREQPRVANNSVFDGLVEPARILPIRQRAQYRRVRDNETWLMKRTDQVLGYAMVDCGLPPDAGIDLRQQCRRNLNDCDSAHIN